MMKVEPIALSKDLLQVVADEPCAPGTPVELAIEELRLQAKSHGTKKRADGRYDLRVRLVGIRRAERERLESLLPQ